MKRPKVIRRRYTREAWRKKEESCIEALERYLESNKEKFKQLLDKALNESPFGYSVEIHPKIQSAIHRAKSKYEKETRQATQGDSIPNG